MSIWIRRSFFSMLVCTVLACASAWAASDPGKSSTSSSKPAPRKTVAKSSPKKTTKKTRSARRRYRKEGSRARLARLKMQPERATEIQQALFHQGYLNQEPTGVYDDATRDAMKRFQRENGFPSSGLPEAKSLMKLGLGPHPLPQELDPASQARAMVLPSDDLNPSPSK